LEYYKQNNIDEELTNYLLSTKALDILFKEERKDEKENRVYLSLNEKSCETF
jgi:hypothetical protein